MSRYNYVVWGPRVPVKFDKLHQMSENDQYLKDLSDSTPRGILLWMQQESGWDFPATLNDFQVVKNFSKNVTIEANRLTKVHFHCSHILGDAASSCVVDIRIYVDSVMRASRACTVEKNYRRAIDDVEVIMNLGAGSHLIEIKAARAIGNGTPSARAATGVPMQFWVEDVGAYIPQS